MTAPPTTASPHPPAGDEPLALRHPARPAQLAWLEAQLTDWRAEGLLDDEAVARIRARYVAHRRFTLARIVLTLGAAFVGIGLIWSVAANLDAMSPLVRFILVAAVWLGLVVVAEVLGARHDRGGDAASPVVGALRLLAAAAFGAVVFQAAQSLQVPAYEPLLVGVWAAGALVYGYAVLGLAPTVLGLVLGAYWLVWHSADTSRSVLGVTGAVAAAAVAAVALGILHDRLPAATARWRALGLPWREVGAVLALGGLFFAALPVEEDDSVLAASLWVVLGLAVLLALAAVLRGSGLDRLEVGLAVAGLGGVVLLGLWRSTVGFSDGSSTLSPGDWARAVVAVLVYLALASGYAVLGGMRDSDRLTWAATAALVLFTTVQAFAVFAPVLSGAVLFLAVGVVLIGTGVLADRGRRRLLAGRREVGS